ncbi:MAG TPA: hypothetical protein VKV80_03855 [Streptosporangiaceae bacterium]|nr:hypothetical protein [Streptosporangiaceae bacterium]
MLHGRQAALVAETLRASLAAAAASTADQGLAQAFSGAASLLSRHTADGRSPHPALPAAGATVTRTLPVTKEDTATAMGHPDPAVAVLGSPRIALWFEVVASALLPEPAPDLTHVGAGILVHHVGRADVGEEVTVRATAEATSGRRVTFSCAATAGSRLIALGTHQRVLQERR